MNKRKEVMISAGIDVGTSTTKLIISRFTLLNVAGISQVPRIEIIEKEIIYKSPMFRTPLQNESKIDIEAVESIIRDQYNHAQISPSDIETGAVIITGEAATKTNASKMVHHLSKEAGSFLVATAGPDLEAIIAAKGSGVFLRSKNNDLVRANVDIGGGTANIAVYKNQVLLGTCTLHVGGRLIEFMEDKVATISPPIERLLKQEQISLQIGDSKDSVQIQKVIHYLVQVLYRALTLNLREEDECLILGEYPTWTESIDIVTFSGGISECMYHFEANVTSPAPYNDIGWLLANQIKESSIFEEFKIEAPLETARATVIGAGTQTTEISGATIQVDESELPLRNIPIYKHSFDFQLEKGIESLEHTFEQAFTLYDSNREGQNFALSITDLPNLSFKDIQLIARKIKKLMDCRVDPTLPIIVIVDSDVANALGQSLISLHGQKSIICIDQIHVNTGDYIDLGRALDSGVVPAVVKTLTFHSSTS